MEAIYLDNAATTRTDPDLAEQMARDMVEFFANPSSPHRPGLAAANLLASARSEVEGFFPGYRAVFTASGSEALNLALKGAFARRGGRANRILISAVEHPAVRNAARDLAAQGAIVEELPVDGTARLKLGALERALERADDVAVVALMQVQNELGTLQPVAEAGAILKERASRAFFLVDAVQGLGKVSVEPARWGASAVAVASHKIHGPKGMGALLLRNGLQLPPLVAGGGQEGGLRSGTENAAGAAAFAKALHRAVDGLPRHAAHLALLRARLLGSLRERIPDVTLNGPEDPALASPAILCVSFRGVPAEVLLHALEEDGIFISAGSACHSKARTMSHVHAAAGFEPWRSESAVRFGLSWHTEEAEVDRAAARVAVRVAELRRLAAGKDGATRK